MYAISNGWSVKLCSSLQHNELYQCCRSCQVRLLNWDLVPILAALKTACLPASKTLPQVSPEHAFCIMHSLHCINNSESTSRFPQALGTRAPASIPVWTSKAEPWSYLCCVCVCVCVCVLWAVCQCVCQCVTVCDNLAQKHIAKGLLQSLCPNMRTSLLNRRNSSTPKEKSVQKLSVPHEQRHTGSGQILIRTCFHVLPVFPCPD